MTSDQLPAQHSSEEKVTCESDKWEGGNENPKSPSPDFSALIDAIKTEGRAYRHEEQREDSAKRFREWITIFLLASTCVAIGWQVHEMIRVYGPIREQANAEKLAADAATKQSTNSEKTLIESQRAWVGPINATIATEPTVGKPVEVTITYQNSGREPALAFVYFLEPFLVTPEEDANGTVGKRLANYMAACKATAKWPGGSVVYPTTGFSSYALNFRSSESFVDDAVTKGNKSIVIPGCFLYRTFGTPKHSYFCYFYKQGMSKIQNLNICPSGHDAD